MKSDSSRSRRWTTDPRPRTGAPVPGMDYVPPVYSDLTEDEWGIIRDWFEETDQSQKIGECVVAPDLTLARLYHGEPGRSHRSTRDVLGLLDLAHRLHAARMNVGHGMFTLDCDRRCVPSPSAWLEPRRTRFFCPHRKTEFHGGAAAKAAIQYLEANPTSDVDSVARICRHRPSSISGIRSWHPAE